MQVISFDYKKLFIFTLLGLLLFANCRRSSQFGFVKNKGAVMPVKIRGKADSPVFIVLLPGGPAGDGLAYSTVFPFFRKYLEPKYRMVYYDQRGAGNCQGIYDTTTLNLPQLSDDLDKILSVIRREHEKSRVYLLGYSYGGALGLTYLKDPDRAAEVAGYISLAGAHDRRDQARFQQQLIEYFVRKWHEEGFINYEFLKDGFNCSDEPNSVQCRRDSLEMRRKMEARFEEVAAYNKFKMQPANISRLLRYAFLSQSNPLQSGINEAQNGRHYQPEFDELHLSDQIEGIKTPALLISGRYDTNVPFFDAQAIYEGIGTPHEKKDNVILEESGHLPMLTQPEELAGHIIRFIEKNQPQAADE